ncbi:penicillin acylase family protein [Gordonia liuliyuniae]|uniref:Penicillin acylase family protein n=1 Tax=Gordonia liuliyuniae TaxID=2911517 RepID=A0ABS9IMX1_9ACTN|nr:penicillin acylase family protein [Gordonia liuliyuniae]MCF8586902.1 penicillin acylase family protein [Gordonia liuliyuniae]
MSTVLRDAHGIPHIRAASAREAIFTQGYTTGVDRAWQVEFLRLRAEGRTAEVFGPAGVGWDEFARRAQIDRAARRIHDASSDRTRTLLRAYADGVNRSHADAYAVELTEFDHEPTAWSPWTPIAIFIVQHLMFGRFATKLWRLHARRVLGADALALLNTEAGEPSHDRVPAMPSAEFMDELLRHIPLTAPDPDDDVPDPDVPEPDVPALGDAISGSNAWGVAAAGTDTGAPLIAGDPHRFIEIPGVYQQYHLACDEFDVVGLSFAGVPGLPHFAHASSVAWGITNAMADYQDVYVEKLRRVGESIVAATSDGDAPCEVWIEQVRVRGGDPVDVEIIATANGSVIVGGADDRWAMSLRTPMLSDAASTFDAVLDLLFASSIDDVEQALTNWVEPPNRIVIGDSSGGLRHHTVGRYPVRADENYWLPVPGWDERYTWQGYAATSLSGYDADVPTHAVIANQRIAECPPMQPITTECAPDARAKRIDALLSDDVPVSVDGCADIHRDVANGHVRGLIGLVSGLRDLSDDASRLQSRLASWDGAMHPDSVDAYLFAEFRSRFVTAITADDALAPLGEPNGFPLWMTPYFVAGTRIAAGLDAAIAGAPRIGVDVQAIAVRVLEELAVDTGGDTGGTATAWGDVHVLAPFHGMDFAGVTASYPELSALMRPEQVPLGGDAECVLANASAVGFSHVCRLGSVARYVWDVADRDASRWIVPLGVSGDPSSDHFQDQTRVWARGDLIGVVSDWDVLARTAAAEEIS